MTSDYLPHQGTLALLLTQPQYMRMASLCMRMASLKTRPYLLNCLPPCMQVLALLLGQLAMGEEKRLGLAKKVPDSWL
jgi:hypothetical protein